MFFEKIIKRYCLKVFEENSKPLVPWVFPVLKIRAAQEQFYDQKSFKKNQKLPNQIIVKPVSVTLLLLKAMKQ